MTDTYQRYSRALGRITPAPALVLDLDAFEHNIQWALKHAGNKKIRIATKSLRSVELIRRVLKTSPVFQGLMAFTLAEALWLREQGFTDILLGYPTHDRASLAELARNPHGITLMVDLPEHIEFLQGFDATFNICLDVDLSMDLPFVRFGVYRSSITSLATLESTLAAIKKAPHVRLEGLMGYEAQIAGVMDKSSWLMRFLKGLSIPRLRERRHNLLKHVLQQGYQLRFVNGGGTGSLQTTNQEEPVTEVTVGSAFYAPVLFDNYQDFQLRPAMVFGLPVVRIPKPGMITCLGGGYIASGATDPIKTPTPYLPAGLKLEKNEGTGEVQTPLHTRGHHQFQLGDWVFMRHAKAGEPCERFNTIHLLRGEKIVGQCTTYRGDGKAFL